MNTPEHDKLAKIQDKSQVIGEFIEWLGEKWDIYLGHDVGGVDDLIRAYEPLQTYLADFFEIDQQKLAEEKDGMLSEIRMRDGDPE